MDRRKCKLVRQVVMAWRFGGFFLDNEVFISSPEAFIVKGTEAMDKGAVTFQGATARLSRGDGKIDFSCGCPGCEMQDLRINFVIELINQASGTGLCAESVTTGRDHFSLSYRFLTESGKQLTAIAFDWFELVARGLNADLTRLPVPQVVNQAFWRLGDVIVPFGLAQAMDRYLGNGFARLREVYREQGEMTTRRAFHGLRSAVSGEKCLQDCFHVPGADIVVGKNSGDCEYRVYVDGFISSAGSWPRKQLPLHRALERTVAIIAENLLGFGINQCYVHNGSNPDPQRTWRCVPLPDSSYDNLFANFRCALKKKGISVS